MKFRLTSERVVQRERHELYDAMLEEIRNASDAPAVRTVMTGSSSPPVPVGGMITVKPYEAVELRFAEQHPFGGGSAFLELESVAAGPTKVRATVTFDVGLGMWLIVKLFGKRFGMDHLADESMDKFVGELEAVGSRQQGADR